MINVIIVLVIASVAVAAFLSSKKHFSGDGGCCGGGGKTIAEEKTLEGAKFGEKRLVIEGMTCENCQNHVQNSLNRLDGVAAKVSLKKKTAVVSFSREVSDDELKKAVEDAGYSVVSIQEVK